MKKQLLTVLASAGLLLALSSEATGRTTIKTKSTAHKTIPSRAARTLQKPAPTMSLQNVTSSSGPFSRAITARGGISLSGGGQLVIDAYNSTVGSYDPVTNRLAGGNIATTSTAAKAISLNNGSICGTAATGPGGTIFVKNGAIGDLNWCATRSGIEPGWTNANVNIAWTTNSPPSGVPTIPTTPTSMSGSNITFLTVDSSVATYKASSFTSGGSAQPLVVLGHSTFYVTGDFSIQGSGYVYIAPGASLTLYVGGQTTISGGGVINDQGTPASFNYIGLAGNQSLTYSGGAAFYGTINAPQADVTLSGSSGTCGAVICNTYTGSGSSSLHYDITLALPTITAPPNLVLQCPADTSTNATGIATAQGGCSLLTITSTDATNNTCGGAKVITRTWTATDACGDSASAVQTITVQDTTPPVVSAPPNLVLPFTADTSTNNTGVATAHDGCSSVTLGYSDAFAPQVNGSEIITRTWTATDACGNSASASQTITLTPLLALVLPTQNNLAAVDLRPLIVTNTAANPNGNTGTLTYQLLNAPGGSAIDANGLITWTPTVAQSPSTNVFTTVVATIIQTAFGSTTLSATNSFVVVVSGPYDGLNMLVDSDGDGLTNLIEYAVGSDPLNSADANQDLVVFITQSGGNHYLAMQYKSRGNAAQLQLQYLPEVSADKTSWFSDAAHVFGVSVTPVDSEFNWVTVRDTTPITAAAARFIRLHVLSGAIESFSPVWVGSDALLRANNLTLFSQRMVRPILSAGTVANVTLNTLTVTNSLTNNQFGTNGLPAYVEFDQGTMIDIANTSSKTVALAANAAGLCSTGTPYRIRGHFTIASLFGTNNETGLVAGPNPSKADNIMLMLPETQSTLTVFWYSNPSFTTWQGWVRADTFQPAADLVVFPEEGVMVGRIAPTDANLYLCGPVKTGVALAPIQPGYNLLGTLKSLSSVTLSALNLYTGDPATGFAPGLNPSQGDNLLVVNPDGSVTTYFYYFQQGVYSGWVNANGFTLANDVLIPPGSAFFINRQAPGAFNWTIPAE